MAVQQPHAIGAFALALLGDAPAFSPEAHAELLIAFFEAVKRDSAAACGALLAASSALFEAGRRKAASTLSMLVVTAVSASSPRPVRTSQTISSRHPAKLQRVAVSTSTRLLSTSS
jgi:hypothetical protein